MGLPAIRRLGLCGAALRLSRLRRQRGRARPRRSGRGSRRCAQRRHLYGGTRGRRSRGDRAVRIEPRRWRRGAGCRPRSAGCRCHRRERRRQRRAHDQGHAQRGIVGQIPRAARRYRRAPRAHRHDEDDSPLRYFRNAERVAGQPDLEWLADAVHRRDRNRLLHVPAGRIRRPHRAAADPHPAQRDRYRDQLRGGIQPGAAGKAAGGAASPRRAYAFHVRQRRSARRAHAAQLARPLFPRAPDDGVIKNTFPGRSAARSGALQTRDRNKLEALYDPGSAVHRCALHWIRETKSISTSWCRR